MANTHIELREFDASIAVLRRLVIRRPDYSQGAFALGNCLRESGRPHESVHAYRLCLEHNPISCDALNNLGLAHGAMNEHSKARDCYSLALSIDPAFRPARQNFAQWLVHSKRHAEALAEFRKLAEDASTSTERISSFQGQVSCHLELTEYDQALELAQNEPSELLRLIKRLHVLPILYQTSEQIVEIRARFAEDLRELNAHLSQGEIDPAIYQEVYEHAWALTNFYLAYQMLNDRPLQEEFARFLATVVKPRLGEYMKPRRSRKIKGQGAMKIGIISPHLKNHNGSIWSLGWLTELTSDPSYEIYSYNLGEEQDPGTERFKAVSKYRHLPLRSDNAEQHLKVILDDQLDVLIFTDIGMHPSSKITSVLRLAPTQAQGWGHPITSGSPTMDYFLGAKGMEPEGNEEHYSETLVRLPNNGLYNETPDVIHDVQCLY
jgi:predicted O-linked N-acetylglucosamine transferase (SPINDLY family)